MTMDCGFVSWTARPGIHAIRPSPAELLEDNGPGSRKYAAGSRGSELQYGAFELSACSIMVCGGMGGGISGQSLQDHSLRTRPDVYRSSRAMHDNPSATYPPINTLKRVADNIWIVDGPTIRFGMPWPKFPFPTRMTIVRLASGDLFVHSPTPPTQSLRTEIEREGRVRFIIGPNRLHYWWIPEWKAAFPDAEVYLAPRIKEQARGRIAFKAKTLAAAGGYKWDAEIATLPIPGSYMTEVEFFHHASRTLIITDLIENFEPEKVSSLFLRLLTWIGGVSSPQGGLPRDLRLSFTWRHKRELRAAARTMLAWDPERVIIAHGRWYEKNGAAELRRAFRWAVD